MDVFIPVSGLYINVLALVKTHVYTKYQIVHHFINYTLKCISYIYCLYIHELSISRNTGYILH